MTGRERLLTAIRGGTPDKVPVALFIQDQGHFLNQMYPDADPWDFRKLQLKVVDLQRQFGADVFLRVLFGLNDPLSIHMGGLNVSQRTGNWDVRTEEARDGSTTIRRSVIRTPGGELSQEFSVNELRPGTFVYACTRKPIRTPQDLDLAIRYEPPMPPTFPEKARAWIAPLKEAAGEDGIVASWSPHGPFNNASLLVDHETLYCLFLTDYPFYERLMNFATDRILDYARAMERAGVDLQCVGGNVPGGFLGKRCYDEYILPFERKYIQFLQANGTPAMYHNCGQIMALAESYKDLGVRVVEPFSPPPLGDCEDLAGTKARVAGAYSILSGIDQVNVLQKGTIEAVERATRERILAGKPGGGFIMQPVDFLEYGTPEKNIEAYVRTAREFSGY